MKEKVVTVEKCHGCADGLHKFEDGKGRRAVFGVEEAQDTKQLGIEAAVPKAQQEAAEDGDFFAGFDVSAAIGPFNGSNRSIPRHVEKYQIKSYKMHQDAQQHNRISTKTIILAQQTKEAST